MVKGEGKSRPSQVMIYTRNLLTTQLNNTGHIGSALNCAPITMSALKV